MNSIQERVQRTEALVEQVLRNQLVILEAHQVTLAAAASSFNLSNKAYSDLRDRVKARVSVTEALVAYADTRHDG